MGAHVIDGRGLAAELKEELAAEVADLRRVGVVPGGVGPITDVWLLRNTAVAARISTRAEAVRSSLETANAGDVVGTGTISVDASARRERIV